jgi:hypothetical protein
MMFYGLTDDQKNGGGNSKSQDRQKGYYQYAFHGDLLYLYLLFLISLSV